MITDSGSGSDRLGCGKSMLEQSIQHFSHTAGIMGQLPRFLQLSEDLGFTQHQRIEPAGYANQVARSLLLPDNRKNARSSSPGVMSLIW